MKSPTSFTTKGVCQVCHSTIPSNDLQHHLSDCWSNHFSLDRGKRERSIYSDRRDYLLHISDKTRPNLYWMIIAIPGDCKLRQLDHFLRSIWLDCCSHMSCFTPPDHSKEIYSSLFWNETFPEHSLYDLMEHYSLRDIFENYLSLDYEYDFANLTVLQIKLFSSTSSQSTSFSSSSSSSCSSSSISSSSHTAIPMQISRLVLLMINETPIYYCDHCSSHPIEMNCSLCMRSFCWNCLLSRRKHDCHVMDSDDFLSIVNSPRVGKCGYCGPVEQSCYYSVICSEQVKNARMKLIEMFSDRIQPLVITCPAETTILARPNKLKKSKSFEKK